MKTIAVKYLLLSLCSLPIIRTTPTAVWPSEFISYTNITRSGQIDDVGSMFYSSGNGAQRVDHSNLFNTNTQALTIWSDSFYAITNNGQDCCIYDEFDFPMPSANWTNYLSYVENETMIGINCYRFENTSMQITYWQSIDSGNPVAWRNYLSGEDPINQFFTSVMVSSNTLSSSLFTLPSSCKEPTVCSTDATDDGNDENDDVRLSAWIIAVIVVGGVISFVCTALAIAYLIRHYQDKTEGNETLNIHEVKNSTNASFIERISGYLDNTSAQTEVSSTMH